MYNMVYKTRAVSDAQEYRETAHEEVIVHAIDRLFSQVPGQRIVENPVVVAVRDNLDHAVDESRIMEHGLPMILCLLRDLHDRAELSGDGAQDDRGPGLHARELVQLATGSLDIVLQVPRK